MFDKYHFTPPTGKRAKPPLAKRTRSNSSPNNMSDTDMDDSQTRRHSPLPDEPPSVSFEVSLVNWLSCLDIFGGVGTSRPSGQNGFRAASSEHQTRPYSRTREGTTDPYAERDTDLDRHKAPQRATRMQLTYKGVGHPMVLELEQEPNVVTSCSLSTYESTFLTNLVFDPDQMVAQVIVGSELMHSAFSEIDQSCKKLSILMTSSHPRARSNKASYRPNVLRFRALSDSGSSEMEFPASISSSDPTGAIEKFIARPESSEQWYDFPLLSRTMTVLRNSIKTSIRMDEAGLLSYQFMMPKYKKAGPAAAHAPDTSAEQDAYCEFLCCPLDTSTMIN